MKKIVFIFLILLFPGVVSAQGKKIVYPVTIPDVGTCSSWAECKSVCADPVYTPACRKWAEEKGLVTTQEQQKQKLTSVLSKAKEIFKCNSIEECKAICAKDEFKEQCSSFANQHGLPGGVNTKVRSVINEINTGNIPNQYKQIIIEDIQKLKQKDSSSQFDIKEACRKEENKQTCTEIAQKIGLAGGNKLNGPGGCQTTESCRFYCNDIHHIQECLQKGYKGPNECTTLRECEQETRPSSQPTKIEHLNNTTPNPSQYIPSSSTYPLVTPRKEPTPTINPTIYYLYTTRETIYPTPTIKKETGYNSPTPYTQIQLPTNYTVSPTISPSNSGSSATTSTIKYPTPTPFPQVQGASDRRSLLQIGIDWIQGVFDTSKNLY